MTVVNKMNVKAQYFLKFNTQGDGTNNSSR